MYTNIKRAIKAILPQNFMYKHEMKFRSIHIDDDGKAISELHRVLKADGTCIVQTPFKEGDIYEDPLIQSSEERLKHFGQTDHVRVYSVQGLKNRLLLSGFQVDVKEYKEPADNKSGFKEKEYILMAHISSFR